MFFISTEYLHTHTHNTINNIKYTLKGIKITTLVLCIWPLFSGDHSRLSQVSQMSSKEPLEIAGAKKHAEN